MKKIWGAVLGATLLWGNWSLQADAVADQKIFEATMKQVDQGGISLSYNNISTFYNDMIRGLDLLDQGIPAQGAKSSEFKPYLALARQLTQDLALSAFQSYATSVKEQADGLYRYRTFVYTGNARLTGPLFNLTSFKNTPWHWLKTLPAATKFAAEFTVTPDRAWLEIDKLLKNLKRPECANLLTQVKQQFKAATDWELEPLLRAVSGRWQVAVIAANNPGMPFPQIYLSLPDQNGQLWQLIKNQSGVEFQKKSATVYTVQLPTSPQPAVVELGRRRITFYSDPALKTRFDGTLLTNPATAPYFKNLSAKGMAFSYLNIDRGLWMMGGAFAPMEIQGILRTLPPPVFFTYAEHRVNGLASTGYSNWRLTPANIAVAAQALAVAVPLITESYGSRQSETKVEK